MTGNLFELAKLLMTADVDILAMVSFTSQPGQVVPKTMRRRTGKHRTTSESQTSEFRHSAAPALESIMKPRLTVFDKI